MYRILRLEESVKGPTSDDCGRYYLFGDTFETEQQAKDVIAGLITDGQQAKRFKLIYEVPMHIRISVE